MNINKIYDKYKSFSHSIKWNNSYINTLWINSILKEILNNWFTICWYEFLRIFDKWTQPFMEYSIYNEKWFSEKELYNEIEELKKKLINTEIKENEVFFDILVKNNIKI